MTKETDYYNLLHAHTGTTHAHKHKHKHKKKIPESISKIPVSVIGGFLGSGKTSLLNHIVSHYSDAPIDVIIREYGEISIDDELIDMDSNRIHVFPGISLHFDPQIMLYGFMENLSEELDGHINRLLIEASGMDEPDYLLRLFLLKNIRDKYRLGSYITIVDAEFAHINLDEYPLVQEQIAFADFILLNKTDLVTSDAIPGIIQRLRRINGIAKIYETRYCRVDEQKILEIDSFDQVMDMDCQQYVKSEENPMDPITTVALTETKPMDKKKINQWLDKVFNDKSIKLLRSKGFLHFADSDYKFEFQGVRTSFHSKADQLWEVDEERKSKVVFIGEGLNEAKMKEEFSNCV